MHPLLLHYYTWAGGNTHTKDIYIYKEREREGGRERHLPNQLVKVK
jgi:hypothetical protein